MQCGKDESGALRYVLSDIPDELFPMETKALGLACSHKLRRIVLGLESKPSTLLWLWSSPSLRGSHALQDHNRTICLNSVINRRLFLDYRFRGRRQRRDLRGSSLLRLAPTGNRQQFIGQFAQLRIRLNQVRHKFGVVHVLSLYFLRRFSLVGRRLESVLPPPSESGLPLRKVRTKAIIHNSQEQRSNARFSLKFVRR